MKASFENTVNILVKAFLNSALLKGDCHACAVGNICAAALDIPLTVKPTPSSQLSELRAEGFWCGGAIQPNWASHFMTDSDGYQHRPRVLREVKELGYSEEDFAGGKQQMLATGYTIDQLARIEFAFETAAKGYTEAAEFAGLMAVVDVLANIHEVDLTTAAAAKALFVKA